MTPLRKTRYVRRRLEPTRRRVRSFPRVWRHRCLAIPNHEQLVFLPFVRLQAILIPPREVGRFWAVLARSKCQRSEVARTNVCVEQPNFFRLAMVQRRVRGHVELDQSAGYEKELHESAKQEQKRVSIAAFVGGRMEGTNLYCPLNPFLVNTLPALTILLHALSGHQLYSEVSTGNSAFMTGSDGDGYPIPWVHFPIRGVSRARVLAANATSISSLTSTWWRWDQYAMRARSLVTHSMQSCAECAYERIN